MSTLNLCFGQKFEKYQSFFTESFQFLEAKFSLYLNRRVFLMCTGQTLHPLTTSLCKGITIILWLTYQQDKCVYLHRIGSRSIDQV